MRRRRGPKVTWFPTFGTNRGDSELNINGRLLTGAAGEINNVTDNAGSLWIYPLTIDQPAGEDPAEAASLADAVGSEWFLRRIVGKFFCKIKAVSEPLVGDGCAAVGLGFFVARADYSDANSPNGAVDIFTGPSGNPDVWASFSPLSSQAIREPWIWRRTWVLSANGWDVGGVQPYPAATVNYGISSLDGPHIDAKTKRRISNDDRLYAAIAATEYPFDSDLNPEGDPTLGLEWWLDYRIVGSLRKARNRGVF